MMADLRDSTLWIGMLAASYLAVLPMAKTMAFRNVTLLALLLCLVWHFRKVRPSFRWPLPLILWAGYLLIFPLISDSPVAAFESFLKQWGRGLLAMLAGAGVAMIFYDKNKGAAFYLGLFSVVPILVHLVLFGAKALTTSSMPWGYWGRETHHADLGYAAGHAVVLLAAAVAAGKNVRRPWALILMATCFLSTAIAHSRAGFAFALLGGVLVFLTAYLANMTQRRTRYLVGALGVLFIGGLILAMATQHDPRWRTMTAQLQEGFKGNALQMQCEGTATIEPDIIARYGAGEQAQRMISSVQYGDGSRVVVVRAGVDLALKHPWGSDGSRQAFQKLLRQECPSPVISMSHTHNGWLDTVLALGWLGAALYLLVFLYFFRQGVVSLRQGGGLNEWALVLVALSGFWILRGFTDSVFRDHMIEMQGFVLSYAAVMIRKVQTLKFVD